MIACKAFEPGLVCRGYQFHEGLNTTDKANCRENGFHCAANPLDCLSYYSNMDRAEYWIVDAGGDVDEDGTKIIQIGITAVDGESVKPDVWYDVDLQRRRLVAKNQCA